MKNINELTTDTLRFLSIEAIQKANSGHPGLPLGAAPTTCTLWSKHLKHNPKNPNWENRDRFILSAGHGSALLYSMLHVFGYDLSIEDLKNFRQIDSKTAGHPEYKHTVGVEVTTGPLGQGIANAVGMAIAEKHLGAKFNKDGYDIVDHNTYVLCGDGCLMEGISGEASSLAGTLGLGKLILLYDSNKITIEGSTDIAFREDVKKRYKAYNWEVITVDDGNDIEEINKAITEAKSNLNQPTLIEIKTEIGFGSPKVGTAGAHGSPLNLEDIQLTKDKLGWESKESFHVPNEVKSHVEKLLIEQNKEEQKWNELMESYKKNHKETYDELVKWYANEPCKTMLDSDEFWNFKETLATRIASEKVLNRICSFVPNLIGGSADLAPSTKSEMAGKEYFSKEDSRGSNIHFGIREHAMGAISNGIALHGGLRTYNAGFFVFADYMKPAMRLSALMDLPVINILTHDSIGVGEDGPTHQPVEQLTMLRSMPNYTVVRPCDSTETVASWYLALTRKSPTGIVLSRQNLTSLKETSKEAIKGGYVLKDCNGTPDLILIASGSEVELIYNVATKLNDEGIKTRVVSMLSMEVYEEQDEQYKESVLPKSVINRVAVEAGATLPWYKYVGLSGKVIGIDTFGASAPANELFKKFEITEENIIEVSRKIIKNNKK